MAATSGPLTEAPLFEPACAVFRRFLKRQGLKFTPERAKILDGVLSKKAVFEADELFMEMREAGHRVSKATIYRTIKHLLDAAIITEVPIDSKQAHYRVSMGADTKGHLVCLETHQIIEFDAPELVELRDRICAEYGFEPMSQRFIVYGLSKEAKESDEG